jgi:two-component system chemotaxis response regulator CheY
MSASAIAPHDCCKALIVDDHASMRRLIRTLLPRAMEAFECRDGADALAVYQEHRPGIVIMDVSMPIMDGLAAAAEIRAFDPAARILFVSQAADEEMRARMEKLGAIGFLAKERLSELPGMLASGGTF